MRTALNMDIYLSSAQPRSSQEYYRVSCAIVFKLRSFLITCQIFTVQLFCGGLIPGQAADSSGI